MPNPKHVGRAVGALLLVLLIAGLTTPYILLHPLTTLPAGFLGSAARMEPLVRLLVLSLFIGGIVPLAIGILLWPAVQSSRPRMGLALLALAGSNFVLQIMENSHWLTMLSLSREYVGAAPGAIAGIELMGMAERAAWKWTHYSHIFIVVAWLFALFLVLGGTRMAPRVLTRAGMLFCVSQFVGITLPVFAGYRMPFQEAFGMPLGVAILALAAWSLARGLGEGAARTEVPAQGAPVGTSRVSG